MIGHDEAWSVWRAARAGTRMHHGWILAGREGLGKASFARAAAADLVAEPGVPQPGPEAHPDIHVLEPLPSNDDEARKRDEGKAYTRKRNISVEQIRGVQRRLVTRPTLGSRRAVIIDAADDLEKGAVNALLKSLEEPPAGTFFLLVTHQIGRLLPTVRSRCTVLRFHPLEPQDMARALAEAAPELGGEALEAAISAGSGAPGAALAFAAMDLGAAWKIMTRLTKEGDPDLALRGELSAALGQRPDRERLLAVIEAARRVLVAAMAHSDDTARLRIVEAHAALAALAAQAPTYNFEPALLLLEIGGLLASVARTRESAA
ncbi:DNA polymerase III subunit delta' [Novosphingobium sp.]|uniref:DNA polymerase III subunit delta' n=1 Tax=Novosphingobium sp. TaxID=1874826 RepID=UPI00262AC990|nr:DNA polymerase III subunit delta' [Novosphingobium sp.]